MYSKYIHNLNSMASFLIMMTLTILNFDHELFNVNWNLILHLILILFLLTNIKYDMDGVVISLIVASIFALYLLLRPEYISSGNIFAALFFFLFMLLGNKDAFAMSYSIYKYIIIFIIICFYFMLAVNGSSPRQAAEILFSGENPGSIWTFFSLLYVMKEEKNHILLTSLLLGLSLMILLLQGRSVSFALIILFLFRIGEIRNKFGFLLVVLVFGWFFFDGVGQEYLSTYHEATLGAREYIWLTAIDQIVTASLYEKMFGLGFGSGVIEYFDGGTYSLHNSYLQVLYEGGVIYLLLLSILFSYIFKRYYIKFSHLFAIAFIAFF